MQFYELLPTHRNSHEAANSELPSISKIKKELSVIENGEIIFNALLTKEITGLVSSFNVGKTMNDTQISFVRETLKSDYFYLKLDEIKFVFNQAKKGKFGITYDRIDCAVICGWLDQYISDRDQILTEKRIHEKKLAEKIVVPDENSVVADFAAMISELKKKEIEELKEVVVERVFNDKPKREKTEQEILVQEIIKEFDLLHQEQNLGSSESIRTINYNNKRVDCNLFLKMKLEEMNKI